MPFRSACWQTLLFLLIFLSTSGIAVSAPLAPEQVPEALKPWVDWALHDERERDCPYLYNRKQRSCSWPSRLALELNEGGGAFVQEWRVFSTTRVRLPGDSQHWPQQVANAEGEALLVEDVKGIPYVKLAQGTQRISGSFSWQKLPRSLPVTPEAGLVTLSVNGESIAYPNITPQGQLWLTQGESETAREDHLEIQVFRKLVDSHPIRVVTLLKLRVSGKQRNAVLAPVLLEGMIPLRLNSPLPARIDAQGQLQLQLKPGEWALQVVARSAGDQTEFPLAGGTKPWPSQEVWVFESDSESRQVEVSGGVSIDPNQTQLPQEWQSLPAYLMTPGEALRFNVVDHGAAQTRKQQLSLQRDMWLDFDGQGYTIKDQINGYIGAQSRLDVVPEITLGRVSLGGEAQLITRKSEAGAAGVEIRSQQINLQAESRYENRIGALPVNGWMHDMQRVDTQLYLPPGWRLFSAAGADNHTASWLQNWNLLDLFLLLLTALATAYLFGWL